MAGSDALSTGLAGCFFYLTKHPESRTKARAEVLKTFASREEIRCGPKLTSCLYLRACIDESLRMSPPVGGAIWREVCSGGIVVDSNYIPEGQDVGIGVYAIHHNSLYFPDPFRYNPERWIVGEDVTEQSLTMARKAFQTFSVGPLGCIGKNLSYMELTLTLAHVLWGLEMREDVTTPVTCDRSYLKAYREHAQCEYRLRDRFTSWKEGPLLSFRTTHGSSPMRFDNGE